MGVKIIEMFEMFMFEMFKMFVSGLQLLFFKERCFLQRASFENTKNKKDKKAHRTASW